MKTLSAKKLYEKIADKRRLFSVQVGLTEDCNENCIHCLVDRRDETTMSKNMLKGVLSHLNSLGCMNIVFTGGEAMLNKDLFEFAIREAVKHKMIITVLSNGTLINDKSIKYFKKAPFLSFYISLYAVDPEIHDSITRRKGSFAETHRAIKLLKENSIPCEITMVVMKKNFDQIRPMQKFSKKESIPVLYDFMIRPNDSSSRTPLRNRISDVQIVEACQMGVLPYTNKKGKLLRHSKRKYCVEDILRNHLYISPKGEVFCNVFLKYKVGDLRENSLSDIWNNSTRLRNVQDISLSDFECFSCKFRDRCMWDIGLAYAEHGDMFKKPQELCRFIKLIGASVE